MGKERGKRGRQGEVAVGRRGGGNGRQRLGRQGRREAAHRPSVVHKQQTEGRSRGIVMRRVGELAVKTGVRQGGLRSAALLLCYALLCSAARSPGWHMPPGRGG